MSLKPKRAMVEWKEFCQLWWEEYGDEYVTTGELTDLARKNELLERARGQRNEQSQAIRMAFVLKKMKDRAVHHWCIVHKDGSKTNLWYLKELDDEEIEERQTEDEKEIYYTYYNFTIARCPETDSFIGRVAEFDKLEAYGYRPEEALFNIQLLVKYKLEELSVSHQEPPKPLLKDPYRSKYSGRLNLQVPSSMHQRLALEAEEEQCSLHALIITKISLSLAERLQTNETETA